MTHFRHESHETQHGMLVPPASWTKYNRVVPSFCTSHVSRKTSRDTEHYGSAIHQPLFDDTHVRHLAPQDSPVTLSAQSIVAQHKQWNNAMGRSRFVQLAITQNLEETGLLDRTPDALISAPCLWPTRVRNDARTGSSQYAQDTRLSSRAATAALDGQDSPREPLLWPKKQILRLNRSLPENHRASASASGTLHTDEVFPASQSAVGSSKCQYEEACRSTVTNQSA